MPRPSRRLAVIIHADVVDSTKLVQRDESIAHERITDAFRRFAETISKYGGNTREIRGDAIVAEFARASDAVISAIAFQKNNAEFIASLEDDIHPQLRVGISLGEVVISDSTVTGAGVVLAQRLEQFAKPGGVVAQGAIYETLPKRLPLNVRCLGELKLKGFEESTRAYDVVLSPGSVVPSPEPSQDSRQIEENYDSKPSIVVLPFLSLSSDSEQRYLADGIVEDVTTELSRFSWIMVIARNSAFTYRGSDKDIRQIGRELKADYALEGSVRSSGDRLRLSIQLAETRNGRQVWAEKFDRSIVDLFELQDELTGSVVARVAPNLRSQEIRRIGQAKSPSFGAWQHHVRGLGHYYRFISEENEAAIDAFSAALRIDDTFALPRAFLSKALFTKVWLDWSLDPEKDISQAKSEALKAVTIAPELSETHYALSCVEFWTGNLEGALRSIDRCLDLNPNFADGYLVKSQLLSCLGRFEEAETLARFTLKLSPVDPLKWVYLGNLADALYGLERWQDAHSAASEACEIHPNYVWGTLIHAATLSRLGRCEDARKRLQHLKNLDLRSPAEILSEYPFENNSDRKRIEDAFIDLA